MKNLPGFLGIIALAAVIVFTACSSGGSGGGGNYRGNPGTPGIPPIAPPQTTQYTVTFNINGGSGTTPEERTVNAGSDITLPGENGFSRSGHTFDGWNTEADGTGYNYSADAFYTVTGDITLYANWITVPDGSFTVTFDSNGGSSVATQIINSGGTALFLVIPTRSGYTFDNWYSDPGLTTVYNFSTPVTSNITLYAKWTAAAVTQYTITFNINGGTGTTPATQTINAGAGLTLPAGGGFSRSGYTFGGWNTQASGTGTNYSPGASYTPTGDITLDARWTVNTAGITLDVGQIIDGAPIINSITISRTGSGYPVTQLVSVENPSSYSSIRWEIAGVGAYAGQTVTGGNGTEANPLPLTANTWTDGSITSTASGSALWYLFNASSGTTYYVWWNDSYSGDGTKTLDVKVSVYYGSGTSIFTSIDSGWLSPGQFTAGTSGTVKIKVEPYSSYSNTGTFAVAYSASSTRPGVSGSTNSGGSSFILDAGDVRYNSPGGHVLKLTVTKNGQQYQRAIPFTIVP
jgi:uncharacterized repeat protein (TIGR02543 family)